MSGQRPTALFDRAREVAARADRIARSAHAPAVSDAAALVALAARDTHSWLLQTRASDVATLGDIAESLDAQARRLDDLESGRGVEP